MLILRAGDVVEVKSSEEIFATLDSKGALEGLPFMPEMLEFCGKRHRVSQKVVQLAIDESVLTEHGATIMPSVL